eukprot:Rmarinus@m.24987
MGCVVSKGTYMEQVQLAQKLDDEKKHQEALVAEKSAMIAQKESQLQSKTMECQTIEKKNKDLEGELTKKDGEIKKLEESRAGLATELIGSMTDMRDHIDVFLGQAHAKASEMGVHVPVRPPTAAAQKLSQSNMASGPLASPPSSGAPAQVLTVHAEEPSDPVSSPVAGSYGSATNLAGAAGGGAEAAAPLDAAPTSDEPAPADAAPAPADADPPADATDAQPADGGAAAPDSDAAAAAPAPAEPVAEATV